MSSNSLEISFTDTSTGALSWWWDFGDGTTSNIQNPTHTYTAEGDYNVTLYIENDIRSWDEITYQVTAEEVLGTNATLDMTVGVYPNPSHTMLNVTTSIPADDFEIYNALGQLVFATKATPSINVNALASGVYILKVTSETAVANVRFVKQ